MEHKTIQEQNTEYQQDILMELVNCSTCADAGMIATSTKDFTTENVDWLIANLPGVRYASERMLNYIFSNGLTTGTDAGDKKLNAWLFEQTNRNGSTNLAVLREVIGNAALYGECGLRVYDGNIYSIKKGLYGVLISKEDGIEEVVGYYIRKDGDPVDSDMKRDEWQAFEQYGDIANWFDYNGLILFDTSEFVNVRNDTSTLHGYSPLLQDKQRVNLLMSTYERLNFDIDYDGPGRIILRPRDSFSTSGENDVSTGTLLNTANESKRINEAKLEAKRVAREIKGSASDSVVLLSQAFDEKIEHLPRVTKATEFFGWIESEGVILAQLLGMSPTLLEVGELHGNVSMEKIIDNAMLNTIIPMREAYAVQFSKIISDLLGVEKIYFDKYDMQQIEDENEIRAKVAVAIRDLSTAAKNRPSDKIDNLLDAYADYLRSSIYDDKGNLRTL